MSIVLLHTAHCTLLTVTVELEEDRRQSQVDIQVHRSLFWTTVTRIIRAAGYARQHQTHRALKARQLGTRTS
jgi:hypothetical protein